jgi:pilus assembly protein CpaE
MARVSHGGSLATAATAAVATAPILVVLGPKGGVGKTTVSTNLATCFAMAGKRTLLVDLDLQFGDVGLVLGIEPELTIYDLVTASGRLDGEKLRGYLGLSADGVHALLAPVRPDQSEAVTPERLDMLLEIAQTEFDVVIVDTPPAFTAPAISAIDRAQHTVVVGSLDLPGLKNMKVGLETLTLMGVSPDQVTLVLNRSDTKVGLSMGDVRQILPRSPDISIPSDRSIPRAVNSARPLVASDPKSRPAKSLRELSDRVSARLFDTKET